MKNKMCLVTIEFIILYAQTKILYCEHHFISTIQIIKYYFSIY